MLCVDEKSQIQALERSAPMLPGTPARASHDYKPNGTSSLSAGLDSANGKVIGSPHARHRAIEFKKFLVKIDKSVPAGLDLHLILDNYATDKTPALKRWLARQPRFHLHFTPTGASWINPRRALVRGADRPQAQRRRPPLSRRAQRRQRGLGRALERGSPPLRLGQERR